MSVTDVLEHLPALTVSERQMVILRTIQLDQAGLSASDEAIIEKRLAQHERDQSSVIGLEEMKERLRARFRQ